MEKQYSSLRLHPRMKFLQTKTQPPKVWPPSHPLIRVFPLQFASARTVVAASLPIFQSLDGVQVRCSACIFLQTHAAVRKRNPKLAG